LEEVTFCHFISNIDSTHLIVLFITLISLRD